MAILLAWMILFSLLPLERFIFIGFLGGAWNAQHLFLFVVLCFVYACHCLAGEKKMPGIRHVLVISLVALLPMIVGTTTTESIQSTFQILLIIWSGPPLYLLVRNHRTLAVLMLTCAITLHAIWGVAQFIQQRDLGVTQIGESALTIGSPGIATFTDTRGSKQVRAYGPYPHPNILGGSIVLSLIALLSLPHLRNTKTATPLIICTYILCLALLLSFSRTAGISLLVLFFVAYWTKTEVVRRAPLMITVLVFSVFLLARVPSNHEVALTERLSSNYWARAIITDAPVWVGTGLGNYESTLEKYFDAQHIPHQAWEVAPVHNTLLLLLAELGVLPTIFVTLWLRHYFRRSYRTTWPFLVPLIPLICFDHYLLTQAAPALYLLLVLLVLADRSPHSPAPAAQSTFPPAANALPIPTNPIEPLPPQ